MNASLPQSAHSDLPEPNWVATIAGLAQARPWLGSAMTIFRMTKERNGIPHRRLGKRLIFNLVEVDAWIASRPGMNLDTVQKAG